MAIENIFGAPPEYLSGLLGVDPEKLRKQALGTGLVNTALAFAAQPRNRGYGSVLPYAAQALMAGQQGAQGVYSGALQDFQTRQKLEDIKRQQTQQQAQQQYVNQFAKERPELASAIQAYPELIPDIVKGQIAPPKRDIQTVSGRIVDVTEPTTPKVLYEAPLGGGDIDKYMFYSSQEKLAGKTPLDFNSWYQQSKKASAQNINVNLPPEALGLGTAGMNEVDKALLSGGDRLSQLNQIQLGFKPEYQTIPFKTSAAWTGLKDKFSQTSSDEQATLRNYSAFRQDSVRQLNDYINAVTGAAIGQGEEADRIKAGVPNVGSGMFDGDSPAEFQAKLDNTVKSLKLAEARLSYIKRNGLALRDVSLDQMPKLIAQREKQIVEANKLNPSNPNDRQLIKQQLAAEFGLVY